MFRPTHFAILFAVILCAYAFPAAPSGPPHARAIRAPAPGPRPANPALHSAGKREAAKGDLDTDATEYWGYRYNDFYGSRWATYEPDVLIPTVYGWPTYYY